MAKLKSFSTATLWLWGLTVGVGILFLQAYAAGPGDAGTPPARWPARTSIRLDRQRPTLLIFLHPLCPCLRASVTELASIVKRCGDRVSVQAILLRSAELPQSRIEEDLAEVPGIRIRQDRGGAESRRFGVSTSGHVLLYDAEGRLTFSGGITRARGHQGDNYGRDAVIAQILGYEGERSRNPVFGCALATPGTSRDREPPR